MLAGGTGLGRLRHLRLAELFVKDTPQTKQLASVKILGKDNLADIHTRHVDAQTLERHRTGYGPMRSKAHNVIQRYQQTE
eukprot:6467591-Amphidinium_carterae.2